MSAERDPVSDPVTTTAVALDRIENLARALLDEAAHLRTAFEERHHAND